jgi:hypothetical protein
MSAHQDKVNSSQNRKDKKTTTTTTATTTITCFALLASVLVLASFAAIPLTTSNAYAQSTSPSVTGSCTLDNRGSLDVEFNMRGEPAPTVYYFQVLDVSSGTVVYTSHDASSIDPISGLQFGTSGTRLGAQYTLNLYEDVDNDYPASGVEGDELVATKTVTCPTYKTLFKNLGECLKYAKDPNNSGAFITKKGCQAAF